MASSLVAHCASNPQATMDEAAAELAMALGGG
jgi:hypothetical protein